MVSETFVENIETNIFGKLLYGATIYYDTVKETNINSLEELTVVYNTCDSADEGNVVADSVASEETN